MTEPLPAEKLKAKLEDKSRFVSIGLGVMHEKKWIAKATSVTMARRIANALNAYTPNQKGV